MLRVAALAGVGIAIAGLGCTSLLGLDDLTVRGESASTGAGAGGAGTTASSVGGSRGATTVSSGTAGGAACSPDPACRSVGASRFCMQSPIPSGLATIDSLALADMDNDNRRDIIVSAGGTG